jgi:competence protein CoiA
MRGGPAKQIHFYHTTAKRHCRQHQKTEEHIQTQLYLLDLIGSSAQMECPFPAIHRIADIVWHEKKIIFEVQCSPISLKEAEERSSDYKNAGYTIFWILHQRCFNRMYASEAELFLRSKGAYYTNMNKQRQGIFYDQFDVMDQGRRLFKGPKLPLDLLSPKPYPRTTERPFWKTGFNGDIFLHPSSEYSLDSLMKIKTALLKKKQLSPLTLISSLYRRLLLTLAR